MRVLSIGNSFSQDAQRYLSQVAACEGTELECVNLYIGGCSLQRHWNNWCSEARHYILERNGISLRNEEDTDYIRVNIQEALKMGPWDVITFQQLSDLSGIYDEFQPYLNDLAKAVRENCPDAAFMIHQTWAYDVRFRQPQFARYHFNQEEMYGRLCEAYSQAADAIGAAIIPSGDVIQTLRRTTTFHADTGMTLNRDGFHMSYTLGRYALAVTWYAALTGKAVENDFVPPDSAEGDDLRRALIRAVAQEVFKQ